MVIELRVELDAWDCFLYSGVLYVVTLESEIRAYNWSSLIESISNPKAHAALHCGFCRADFTTKGDWQTLMTRGQFHEMLRTSVLHASAQPYFVDSKTLAAHQLFAVDNPVGSITSAFTIYKNTMYLASSSGIEQQRLGKNRKGPKKHSSLKIWEGRAVSLVGGGISSLAVAAGSDGAFRYRTESRYDDSEHLRELSSHHTTAISWTDISVFRTSRQSPGELLNFARPKGSSRDQYREPDYFVATLHTPPEYTYTWASKDRIFGLRNNTITIFNWDKKLIEGDLVSTRELSSDLLRAERHINLQPWKGAVLAAGSAEFGTVIECDNALIVVDGDGRFWTAPYDVARWRTYNRSTYYSNQLHLITQNEFIALAYMDPLFEGLGPPARPVHRIE